MEIRELPSAVLPDALNLIWRVFLDFEAPDYSEQGVESFRRFIQLKQVQALVEKGELHFWGAYEKSQLVGTIAVKHGTHISMLFVDPDFHRMGVGTRLFENAFEGYRGAITVNSSPYAVAYYHRLGFKDQSKEQIIDGIRFTPMMMKR